MQPRRWARRHQRPVDRTCWGWFQSQQQIGSSLPVQDDRACDVAATMADPSVVGLLPAARTVHKGDAHIQGCFGIACSATVASLRRVAAARDSTSATGHFETAMHITELQRRSRWRAPTPWRMRLVGGAAVVTAPRTALAWDHSRRVYLDDVQRDRSNIRRERLAACFWRAVGRRLVMQTDMRHMSRRVLPNPVLSEGA